MGFQSSIQDPLKCYHHLDIYRVSQKKRNGGFSVHCKLKVLYIFTSLDKTSSAEENDTIFSTLQAESVIYFYIIR